MSTELKQLAPKRVVIGADKHAILAEMLRTARPDLEVRGNVVANISLADLEWGDTYFGFRRPRVSSMGNIRWVHSTGAGVDPWLYPTEIPNDILLTRSSESFGPMIAEWALSRALAFTQQVVPLAESQKQQKWAPREIEMLSGTKAVVVGIGDVGVHCARLFRALGCSVIGVSRSGKSADSVFDNVVPVAQVAQAVQGADWLILMLPLTAETRHVINRDVLQNCKNAILINAGRGAVVDESAIPEALDSGWLRGAALDVFETEPLPATSPLWLDKRVIVSPHISGITTTKGAISGFLECLNDFENGRSSRWVVDRSRQY
ncbi:MAG: D-2-hydroxyacid dehydrogenase [Gemmatimonadaceae bacterium]